MNGQTEGRLQANNYITNDVIVYWRRQKTDLNKKKRYQKTVVLLKCVNRDDNHGDVLILILHSSRNSKVTEVTHSTGRYKLFHPFHEAAQVPCNGFHINMKSMYYNCTKTYQFTGLTSGLGKIHITRSAVTSQRLLSLVSKHLN